ncbi:polymer-forming cytoskeletal protein [Solidesulfovibrio sp.]|uniref:polymer-forming cytoskeletal protein n=1 Tax=Solidesulfovibrio sp. TaxID=2910990 RepID=UPI002B21EAC4|nr:polymer-forming cytoskeletal protein [Solidesulfovibrio sp.]MEA4856794.1 polymer-forming cytoskeletal protein [Solidesulfovibrio sp.]
MQTRFFFRVFHSLCGKRFGGSTGSSLLWAIGALVVMGAVGASIALMTPATMQSKLQQEAGMRAYYNANSGLNYILSEEILFKNANYNFSNFTSSMGGGSVVTSVVSGNDIFTYQIGNMITNGANGTYQITNLIGAIKDSSGNTPNSYVIYGGGKGSSAVRSYFISSSSSNLPPDDVGAIGATLNFSGSTLTGNYIFQAYSFNGGVTINGSLDYTGSSCLTVVGNRVGLTDGTSHICSSSCVVLDGGVTIYGAVYAQTYILLQNAVVNGSIYAGSYVNKTSGQKLDGSIYAVTDVSVTNGTVTEDIYAGGNVTIDGGSTVQGNIYATGNVNVTNGTVKKNVTSGGNVVMSGWSSKVNGNVYYVGNFTPPPSSSQLGGSAMLITTKPTAPSKPSQCTTYTLPTYQTKTVNRADPNSSSSTTYTISGSTDLSDESWVFPSFNMTNGGSKLCLDLSVANSYVNIFVNGNFNFYGTVQLKTTSGGSCANASSYSDSDLKLYAKRIYMAVGGATNFYSSAHLWVGTIFSQGSIKGNSTLNVIGALYSNGTIDLGGGSVAFTIRSDYVSQW